jgi:predicted amidophosphoribosyltransferase
MLESGDFGVFLPTPGYGAVVPTGPDFGRSVVIMPARRARHRRCGSGVQKMSYRAFTRPAFKGWTSADWVDWAQAEDLLLDVRSDIPGGVCDTCWGGTGVMSELAVVERNQLGHVSSRPQVSRWPRCYKCKIRGGLEGVLAISYSTSERLESAIWHAKDGGEQSRWLNLPLAAVLHRFLRRHLRCIERAWGKVDIIAPLPSHPEARGGWDHLRYLVSRASSRPAADRWADSLLEKLGTSAAGTRRDAPVDDLFQVAPGAPPLVGKRVLLIDDTFTSGNTLRSAAQVIVAEGGLLPIALTIGRQVRPDTYGKHILDDVTERVPLFDMERCAIHHDRTTVR